MDDIGLGHELEEFHADMQHGPDPGRRIVELAGIGFRKGDQFLHVIGLDRGIDHEHQRQGADDAEVPALAREALQSLFAELSALEIRIKAVEAVIMREHRSNAVSRRLTTIPGIGPITASALAGTIADPFAFKSGRELAAWIGLVPRQHSSGGKHKMGRVSKQGDRYLRRLLTVGATAVMRRLTGKTDGLSLWVRALLDRRPFRLVSLALANKMARIAWAIRVRPEAYKASAMTAAA